VGTREGAVGVAVGTGRVAAGTGAEVDTLQVVAGTLQAGQDVAGTGTGAADTVRVAAGTGAEVDTLQVVAGTLQAGQVVADSEWPPGRQVARTQQAARTLRAGHMAYEYSPKTVPCFGWKSLLRSLQNGMTDS